MGTSSLRQMLDARGWDLVLDLTAGSGPEALRHRPRALVNDADQAEGQALTYLQRHQEDEP